MSALAALATTPAPAAAAANGEAAGVSAPADGSTDTTAAGTSTTTTAFQQFMMAADLQAVLTEAAPAVAATAAAADTKATVGDVKSKPDETQPDAGVDATQPELAAALAAMAMLPWPVTAPTETRTPAAVNTGATDTMAASTPKAAAAVAAAVTAPDNTALPVASSQALAPPSVDATAPVPSSLLLDHEPDKSAPVDTAAKSPARAATDALVEIAGAFTPISRTAPQSAPVVRAVAVPVHDPHWPQAIAAEVRWCTDSGVQSATLKLVPDNLGPMEVHVDIKDNQVNVNFGASHAETRQALEQSLPRLRELLAGSGLSLGQTSVQQEARRESQNPVSTLRGLVEESSGDGFVPIRVAAGLLDEYA